jgi:hypothetical protein
MVELSLRWRKKRKNGRFVKIEMPCGLLIYLSAITTHLEKVQSCKSSMNAVFPTPM